MEYMTFSNTVFFKLAVQGLREIGVSYCVHKMTVSIDFVLY